MRPRSIGTSSTVDCGAVCVEEGAEAVASALGISVKERRRPLRQRRQDCRRRLPSIWVIVTSTCQTEAKRHHTDVSRTPRGPVVLRSPAASMVMRVRGSWRASASVRRRRRATARTPESRSDGTTAGDTLV